MHQQLTQSFANPSSAAVGGEAASDIGLAPSLWVTKWVDYTSKYGLGFLLCNGSAGVYFNDSTKIILEPNGKIFQYIERTRRSKNGKYAEAIRETHTLDNYPEAMKKKVTLLNHFRNYLVDQSTKSGETDAAAAVASSIPGSTGSDIKSDDGPPMEPLDTADLNLTYVKKWVKTRHAILFRLSNRTVQVNFFDNSEIVLSSEARLITYVDKQRNRNTFTLNTIMQNSRPDIAKRLKYTKDILYQMITGARR
jgi:polo-like kinase 1